MSDNQENPSSKQSNPAIVSAIGGVIGSSIGKFFVHPIDTIKAKIQVQSKV